MQRAALKTNSLEPEISNEPSVFSVDLQAQPTIELSVVCPFFNEEEIIEEAVIKLLERMKYLNLTWELIVVNDGSTDVSRDIVATLCKSYPQLKLVSYLFNRGRGYALRRGIAQARGDIIVTTEIDLSWGEDIVERLYNAVQKHPEVDIVVASPHLQGGGYKNVPWKRVFFSRFGNWVIRACMTNTVTMNTGMTRAYRREVIQSIPLEEDGKEFHLEVIMKAHALKYRLCEIPSVLEWKTYKHRGKRVQRKSSSKIKRLVVSHSLFSLFANPIRYVWGLSAGTMFLSLAFLAWSVARLLLGLVSAFTLIVSLSLAIISLMFFSFGVIAQQGNMIQRELWTVRQSLLHLTRGLNEEEKNELNHGSHSRS
jgi:glycosyltransferase involved in cell wall biosynthesis